MSEHDSSPAYPQAQNSDDWLNTADSWWSQALGVAGAGFRRRLDAEAKRERVQAPERVSPDLFNAHVTDDLQVVIRSWACFVRLDMADYAEAMDACLAYAWRRGAWGLSAAHLADLQDWLHQELARAIGPEI